MLEKVDKILTFALYAEAEPFIRSKNFLLKLKKPFKIFQSENILLVISGMGKEKATNCAEFLIENFKAKELLNLGSAGSLSTVFKTGEIFQVKSVLEVNDNQIITNEFQLDSKSFRDIRLVTMNHPVISDEERNALSAIADIVDMEACSIVKICEKFYKRCSVYKIVSDLLGDSDSKVIIQKIKDNAAKMYEFCLNEKII